MIVQLWPLACGNYGGRKYPGINLDQENQSPRQNPSHDKQGRSPSQTRPLYVVFWGSQQNTELPFKNLQFFMEPNYILVTPLSFSLVFRVSTLITPGRGTYGSKIYVSLPKARAAASLYNYVTTPSLSIAGSTNHPTPLW